MTQPARTASQPPQFLAVIGGGNIAQAILLSGSTNGTLEPAVVVVAEPDAGKRERLRPVVARAVPSAAEAVEWLGANESRPGEGQLLLAIKPQVLPSVGPEIGAVLGRGGGAGAERVVVSVLAGTPTARIRGLLGGRVRVIRAMPNLPIRVRQGLTALALGAGARPGDEAFAEAIFAGLGRCVRIEEALMDAFTAVGGAGPAYVFYLAEAMARAAVEAGFEPDAADRIVRETIAGAGAMLAASRETAAGLRAAVTSKGGTTEAALSVLERAGVGEAIVKAVVAARDRGRELAGGQ